MSSFKERITGLLNSKCSIFIFASLFILNWFDYLLASIVFSLTKHSVSMIATYIIEILCIVLAFLLLVIAIKKTKENPKLSISDIVDNIPYFLLYIGIYLLNNSIGDLVTKLTIKLLNNNSILFVVINFIVELVFAIAKSFVVISFIYNVKGIKKNSTIVVSTLLLGLYLFVIPYLDYGVNYLISLLPDRLFSAYTNFICCTVTNTITTLIILILLSLIIGKQTEDERINNKKRKLIASIIIIICGVVSLVISDLKYSDLDVIDDSIDLSIVEIENRATLGDITGAATKVKETSSLIDAWQFAVLNEDKQLIIDACNNFANNEQIHLLYALTYDEKEFFNALYTDGELSDEWALCLIDKLSEKTLNDQEKQIRDELIAVCIRNASFVNETIYPSKFSNKLDDFMEMLNSKRELLGKQMHYVLLDESINTNTKSKNFVDYALDLANEYPTNMSLQYFAGNFGSSYLVDNASHYERTKDVLLRYIELYEENGYSEDEVLAEKLNVITSLLTMNLNNDVIKLSKDLASSNQTAANLYINALTNLNKNEECLAFGKQSLNTWDSDINIQYQVGLSALKLKDYDVYIDALKNISDVIIKSSDNDLIKTADNALYLLMERSILQEASAYNTRSYQYFDEAQLNRINNDNFLSNYYNSILCWNNRSKYDEAIEYINNVININDNLALAHYHKGIILYQRNIENDRKEAVVEFEKSLSLDLAQPTTWYMLACTYDSLGEYTKAYNACLEAIKLNPTTDHKLDVFGVAIHTNNLKEKLESKIKEGN